MSEYKNGDTASWDASQVRRRQPEQPVRRKRRRRRNNSARILIYCVSILLVSAILAAVGWMLMSDLCAFNKEYTTATVEVTADDTLSSVANKLHEEGLIKYKWFFKFFGGISNAEEKIGIGTYELNTDMDYRALIVGMHNSSGNLTADTVTITIPEGYTVAQTIKLLANKGVNTEAALIEAAQTATFDYDFIDNSSEEINRLEGYLFPDTYEFYIGEKPANALRRLLSNFASQISSEECQAKLEASDRSLKEIIIIASLIEKETDGTDQRKIASVIYNRLADGGEHGTYKMLNIDAALLYGLPDHEGALTKEDKKTDTPYNLYKYAGLPPTAIANPGMASISAALEPDTTDYYYYALGTDGVHYYSKTLSEHNDFLNSGNYGG